jgi:hypothetical protein
MLVYQNIASSLQAVQNCRATNNQELLNRHTRAVAALTRDYLPSGAGFVWSATCKELADLFARDNGTFKRHRFEQACVPGANVRARS